MTAALSDSLLLFGLDLGKLLEGGLPGLGAIAMEGSNGFACPGFEGLVGLENGVKQADWAVVLRVEVVVPIVDQSTCQEGNWSDTNRAVISKSSWVASSMEFEKKHVGIASLTYYYSRCAARDCRS